MHPPDPAAAEPWPEPNLNIPPDDTPEGHRIRSRTTWLLARYDYLQGDSAAQVCERYGLKERSLYDRARREGWRKCDQPDPEHFEPEVDDSPVDCMAMADEALAQVRSALRRRRPAEAASWMRVHDKLTAAVAAREERARRSARVDRERGGASAINLIEEQLRAVREIAGSQAAVDQAAACGALTPEQAEQFSRLNQRLFDCLPGATADPQSSHSDFFEDDDPEPEDPGGYEPPLF